MVVVGVGTGVLMIALKVLTTSEQPPQSTELVEVIVEAKAVLVASSGNSKTGCNVVHVWAYTFNKKNRTSSRLVIGIIITRDMDEKLTNTSQNCGRTMTVVGRSSNEKIPPFIVRRVVQSLQRKEQHAYQHAYASQKLRSIVRTASKTSAIMQNKRLNTACVGINWHILRQKSRIEFGPKRR